MFSGSLTKCVPFWIEAVDNEKRLYARIGFLLHLLRLLRFYWNTAKSESQVTPLLFKYSKKWKSGYSVLIQIKQILLFAIFQ